MFFFVRVNNTIRLDANSLLFSFNFLLSQIHYMYFAAFSFWVTGAVAAAVSLITPRDEEFRVK